MIAEVRASKRSSPNKATIETANEDTDSKCPECGAPLVERSAKRGARAGKKFYGCSTFPKCRFIRNIDA